MLQKQKSYKNKAGETVVLKRPNMKVIGKDMDKDEKRRVVILSKDGVKFDKAGTLYPNGNKRLYDSWSVFVKDEGDEEEESGYYMNLSAQSGRDLTALKPQQFDVFELSKDLREGKRWNKTTKKLEPSGQYNAVVVWTKIEENSESEPTIILNKDDTQVDLEPKVFQEATAFEKTLVSELKNVNADIPTAIRNFKKFKDAGKDVLDISRERVEFLMRD